MEITVNTGCQNEHNKININWINSNMAHRVDILEFNVKSQDKPRMLEIILNDVKIAEIEHTG